MNNKRTIKKMEQYADRILGKSEWHIPEIYTLIKDVKDSFAKLDSICKEEEITDTMVFEANKAVEVFEKNIDEILSNKEYKKYHPFFKNIVLPEAIRMMGEIENKKISDVSPIVAEAKDKVEDMKKIEEEFGVKSKYVEEVIRKIGNDEHKASGYRWDSYHVEIVGFLDDLKKIDEQLKNLKTLSKFQEQLDEVKKEGDEYCKKIFPVILEKQEQLEELDQQLNPDNPLFDKKYSLDYKTNEDMEVENQ